MAGPKDLFKRALSKVSGAAATPPTTSANWQDVPPAAKPPDLREDSLIAQIEAEPDDKPKAAAPAPKTISGPSTLSKPAAPSASAPAPSVTAKAPAPDEAASRARTAKDAAAAMAARIAARRAGAAPTPGPTPGPATPVRGITHRDGRNVVSGSPPGRCPEAPEPSPSPD